MLTNLAPCRRWRLEEPLQEAFRAAEAAEQLRLALEANDEALLRRGLRSAQRCGVGGLQGPERALEELLGAKERVRNELLELVEKLELGRFEAYKGAEVLGEELGELREMLLEGVQEERAMKSQ